MKKLVVFGLMGLLLSCSVAPITGRPQLKLVSEASMANEFAMSYREMMSDYKKKGELVTGTQDYVRLQRVGKLISKAVDQYLIENNMREKLETLNWEFNLIKSDEVNAWCGPGGKIAFYTGIMKYFKSDAELAFVMGHEIGHAIAGHSAEGYSKGMLMQGGALAVELATGGGVASDLANHGMSMLYLKGNRTQEYEADKLGMVFMAMAGYNPAEGVKFQKTLGTVTGGDKGFGSDFMSTHPRSEKRIEEMEKFLPKAMEYYNKRGN